MDLVDGGDDPVLLELLPGQPPPLDHLGVLRRQHRVGHQQVDVVYNKAVYFSGREGGGQGKS